MFISNYFIISLCFCYSLCVCLFSKIKFLLCFLLHVHFTFFNYSIKDPKGIKFGLNFHSLTNLGILSFSKKKKKKKKKKEKKRKRKVLITIESVLYHWPQNTATYYKYSVALNLIVP